MGDQIRLRTATAEDLEFLFELLKVSLGAYVEQTYGAWHDPDQRARFMARTQPETHRIIEVDGQPVGCLAVQWLPDQVKLNRVFLLPSVQGRGIGSQLVRQLLAQAQASHLPVRLRVFKVNPAQCLWRRLGFAVVGETETHVLMEHAP